MTSGIRQALIRHIKAYERVLKSLPSGKGDPAIAALRSGLIANNQDLRKILNEFPEPETTTEWGVPE